MGNTSIKTLTKRKSINLSFNSEFKMTKRHWRSITQQARRGF